jgi:hypothetical protein
MVGRRIRQGLGAIVLASVLLAPAAQAVSWLDLDGKPPRVERADGLLRTLWRQLVGIFEMDGDNRGTIDPNG